MQNDSRLVLLHVSHREAVVVINQDGLKASFMLRVAQNGAATLVATVIRDYQLIIATL